MKCVAKLAKLATAVTAVKAGDNEFTLYDGIKFLSDPGPIIVYPSQ